MTMPRNPNHAGFTMVEMMVALTIGLMILAGLSVLFANTSNNQRELLRSAQQIENGRYAIDVVSQDIRLAGYLGPFTKFSAPTALPDPCDVSVAGLQAAINLAVQGYTAASLASRPAPSATCAKLPAANLAVGSDILVVRRTDTVPLGIGAAPTAGDLYLQSTNSTVLVQAGGGTFDCTHDASGAVATLTRKCVVPAASDACVALCTGGGAPSAEARKLRVQIYFVAPCSVPAGGGDICTGGSDDGGRPIPTLKRLEIVSGALQIVSIAEGVEYMKVEYGIDDTPAVANSNTGLIGDGSPDRYSLSPSLADFSNAVTVRVDLLVRNPEPSVGFTDAKVYNFGVNPAVTSSPAVSIGPMSDAYRRHIYSAETRLVNLSGRKENP